MGLYMRNVGRYCTSVYLLLTERKEVMNQTDPLFYLLIRYIIYIVITDIHMARCTRYNIMRESLSATCGRSVVFSRYHTLVSSTNKIDCHDITVKEVMNQTDPLFYLLIRYIIYIVITDFDYLMMLHQDLVIIWVISSLVSVPDDC
jgi:hypothetical protein